MSLIDEDDDGFNVSQIKSSKLSTLFSSTFVEDEDTNQTLKYVPPKQPKTIEIPIESSASKENRAQKVIHAIPVTAYKFDNQQYRAVGCVGCALIASNLHNFKLVLYTGKQQYVCYATINYDFVFTVQPNNYCTFYDDKTENWSLLFGDDKSLTEFAKKIAFCKVQSLPSPKLICQDIRIESFDGTQVELTDSLELKYKAWTVEELDKLGTIFDSSESSENRKPFRIKLNNKSKVWHEMLVGMRAASQRFCLVPIEFKDDFSGIIEKAILYETTVMLAFELELIRIKQREAKESKEPVQRQRTETLNSSCSQDETKRSNSISSICADDYIDNSKKSTKSDILSRVAKVGTQIMIHPKSKTTEEENIEINENKEVRDTPNEEPTKVKPLPKPRTNSLHIVTATEIPTVMSSAQSVYTAPVIASRMEQPTFVPYGFSPLPAVDSSVNRIVTEVNSNHSELRHNLSKITDKLEMINSKVDDLQSVNKIFTSATTIGMDSTLLLASIQKIVNDNNNLKIEVEEKNSKLDKLNEKFCELLSHQLRGQPEDKSPDMEAMNKRLQDDLQKCLHEKEYILREKEVVEKENDLLKKDKLMLIKEKDEISSQMESLKFQIEKKTVIDNASNKDIESKVKKIMNVLYRTVVADVEKNEESSMSKEEIVNLLANAIRTVTFEALEIESNSPQRSPFHKPKVNSQETGEGIQMTDDKRTKDECRENSLQAKKEEKAENEELQIENDNKSNIELSNNSNEFSEILKWKPRPPSPPVFNCSDEDDEDKWLA